MHDPRPVLTEKRRQWLEKLQRHTVASYAGKGPVRFHCMRMGWTQWAYRDNATGEVMTSEEARKRYGVPRWWDHVTNIGEMLTDAGRDVLAASQS